MHCKRCITRTCRHKQTGCTAPMLQNFVKCQSSWQLNFCILISAKRMEICNNFTRKSDALLAYYLHKLRWSYLFGTQCMKQTERCLKECNVHIINRESVLVHDNLVHVKTSNASSVLKGS